jgi:hypothetical protein
VAELAIYAVSNTHPIKDSACYKRGDIVEVREDGADWGTKVRIPPRNGGKFVIVRITGVTVEQVNNWCIRVWGRPIDSCREDAEGNMNLRRVVRIDVDDLPGQVRNTLNREGFYENSWSNIRDFIRNKNTDTTGTGSDL